MELDEEMIIEQPPTPEELVEKWQKKFDEGVLTPTDFRQHWKTWVPKIYSPGFDESCLNWNFNEELGQEILFQVLEQFICKGDPNSVLSNLSKMDKPPSVCGKVFKMGEPTYSCRECGMDNTCVLCVDCFKHSEHRFHKYKMGMSQGGGCCDCGDTEAWRKAPFCEVHLEGTKTPQAPASLPEDLQQRTEIVFEAVLWYAYNLLSTGQVSDIRLGDDLKDNFFDNDTYCTILYNDEIHTFEQVIGTLTRVLKCNQRTAVEFVTNIDREGRAVVKCSSFQICNHLKQEIEKYTSRHGNKALKVLVSHAGVIAHQLYAMKLLSWLQNFLGHGEGFRRIFAKVALQNQGTDPCIIKGILLRDSTLWKTARSQWQHLLISGMLLEYESKKDLAKIFTKNYGPVMKDFIKDDHEHSYSISCLSVQLFTVPTMAHHLIAFDDVLYILLNTFMSECSTKCNKAGKLEFERTPQSHAFKRAQFMLYDLRYLLSAIPSDNWNDDLRKNFLHGLCMLLNLFTKMQGMDSVTRQVGQHMEYEPEWEAAFNLHIRLAYCISLAIQWCGTDKVVLVKAYRAVLKKLEENPCFEPHETFEAIEIADHSASCIIYDVASRPVSIHLPLSRFLAGLHVYLERFNLHNEMHSASTKPTPVEIMEPVLRSQVMIAQVHAGMWRRNGYALLNQLYFYHNVKCRTEMLDRDITLLQMCASLIEANEFMIHVIHKFNLVNWACVDYEINSLKSSEEDSMRQTISLVEEFLQLVIVIVGERYMPGISNATVEDRIKKEIIQHLCIKPMAHSELNKIITDDMHETALDDVIDQLATFKKPTQSTGKGVYELKDEYFDEYNVFFYHYTREDLSKSEETQRKRRKTLHELECCPPPKLLKLNESFYTLVDLLQCDVTLHVIQTVLERCNNLKARSFSELQLHKVLHLIGYALQEEESKNYPHFKFIQNSTKFKIFHLLTDLLECPRVDAHKGLLKWVIRKFKDVAHQKEDSHNELLLESNEGSSSSSKIVVDDEKERRARLAAERRAKIMAQMAAQQKNFMLENAQLFEESSSSTKLAELMDTSENIHHEESIALGPRQTTRVSSEKTFVCILCQEEAKITKDGPCLVLAAFVQQSTVLCQHKNNDALDSMPDPLYLQANLGPAPHSSTCGHVMHSDCWRKYFENVMTREHRRPYRLRHPSSFDVDKQEFLCPLCECLSNTVLPLVPSLNVLQPSENQCYNEPVTYDEFLECINEILTNKWKMCHGIFKCNALDCDNNHCTACMNGSSGTNIASDVCEANCMLQPYQVLYSIDYTQDLKDKFSKLFPEKSNTQVEDISSIIRDMIQLFAQVTYTRGLNVSPHPSDKRLAPMVWKSLSYTIHSIEVLLRDSKKPLLGHLSSRHRDCIENLVRIVGVLGATWSNSVVINHHALNLLSILFEHSDEGPSILQFDSLGFLIPMTFALPSISSKDAPTPIPTGGTLDLHILKTIFIAHIVKILILMDLSCNDSMETDSSLDQEDHGIILRLLKTLGKANVTNTSTDSIWKNVQQACVPFLRSCCLFYHYLTDVPAPLNLCETGGDTFSNMCTYLDLPQNVKNLFVNQEKFNNLIAKWCNHEQVKLHVQGVQLQVVREPLPVNRLIDLPHDYSELINTVSTFTCPNSDEDSRNPSMCLVCGEILCAQSYCCQKELNNMHVGACNYHAQKCGAGVGIFLRVRECEILFLATPHRGIFDSPPYLDDYGETDMGLRRGNPLKLCKERYKKLQTLWLSHSIHEEIARGIESNSHIVTMQWHHL